MKNEWQSQNAVARIHWHLPSLPPVEQAVARYILDNPETVLTLTMEGLAERTHASYATVNRFCRRLGYAGYREFCRGVLAYLTGERDLSQMTQELTVHAGSSVQGICSRVHRLAQKVLDDSFELIDAATIEAVAHALIHAHAIGFAGVGSSALVAEYACSRLFRIGLTCYFEQDSTLSHIRSALLGQGDVLVAISSSGRTAQIVEMAAAAKKNGVTVVGLSDFCVTPLSQQCDYNLFTTGRSTIQSPDRDIQFLTGQFAIVDVLYLYCSALLGDAAADKYQKTIAAAQTEKLTDKLR